MAPTHDKTASTRRGLSAGVGPKIPSEPVEDTPVYVISGNHGLTAHMGYWNRRTLLQLCTQCQDRNGSQRNVMFTVDLDEVHALEHDISQVEAGGSTL